VQYGVAADHPKLVPGDACWLAGDGRPAFEAQRAADLLGVDRYLDADTTGYRATTTSSSPACCQEAYS
jgi:hypothetical protein